VSPSQHKEQKQPIIQPASPIGKVYSCATCHLCSSRVSIKSAGSILDPFCSQMLRLDPFYTFSLSHLILFIVRCEIDVPPKGPGKGQNNGDKPYKSGAPPVNPRYATATSFLGRERDKRETAPGICKCTRQRVATPIGYARHLSEFQRICPCFATCWERIIANGKPACYITIGDRYVRSSTYMQLCTDMNYRHI
jgi:hypothetical protein